MSPLAQVLIFLGSFVVYVFVAGLVWHATDKARRKAERAISNLELVIWLAVFMWPFAAPTWLAWKAAQAVFFAPAWIAKRRNRVPLPKAQVRK